MLTPYIGMPVTIYGGENGFTEHAGIVTFVHKNHQVSLIDQVCMVSVRMFLNGVAHDKVLPMIPLMSSRQAAVSYNMMGAGFTAYVFNPDEPEVPPMQGGSDNLPPSSAQAKRASLWMIPEGAMVQ